MMAVANPNDNNQDDYPSAQQQQSASLVSNNLNISEETFRPSNGIHGNNSTTTTNNNTTLINCTNGEEDDYDNVNMTQQQQQLPPQQPAHQQQVQNNNCAGCRMPIKDRFIFSVIEQNFHQDCVRCIDCSVSLNERCYTFDGKLYCRHDYWRRFGPKCRVCMEPIKPTELVQRLKDNLVYHLACFNCQDCKRHLKAGEQLHLIDDKRLLCKQDFLRSNTNGSGGPTGNQIQLISPNNLSETTPASSNSSTASTQQQQSNQENQSNELHETNASSNGNDLNAISSLDSSHLQANILRQQQTNNLNLGDHLITDQDHQLMDDDDLDDSDKLNEDLIDELDDGGSLTGDGSEHQTILDQYGGPMSGQSYGSNQLLGSGGGGKEGDKSSAASLVDCSDDMVDANGKRRGPRTTIKPKQLETLRRAFESAPKPSRMIREQLAGETGLNMRVIQVWFQNRRSKERRMKNSNGSARRNFFRSSSRRLRAAGGATPASANGPSSLIAAANPTGGSLAPATPTEAKSAIKKSRQPQSQLSPMVDSNGQQAEQTLLAGGGGQRLASNHNISSPPADFSSKAASGGGGFSYFSDSSNQGDAFAINTGSGQYTNQNTNSGDGGGGGGATNAASNNAANSNNNNNTNNGLHQTEVGAGGAINLLNLGSPSGGVGASQPGQQTGASQGQAARGQQQSQYMKGTPPPIYPQQQQPAPGHLMLVSPGSAPGQQPMHLPHHMNQHAHHHLNHLNQQHHQHQHHQHQHHQHQQQLQHHQQAHLHGQQAPPGGQLMVPAAGGPGPMPMGGTGGPNSVLLNHHNHHHHAHHHQAQVGPPPSVVQW